VEQSIPSKILPDRQAAKASLMPAAASICLHAGIIALAAVTTFRVVDIPARVEISAELGYFSSEELLTSLPAAPAVTEFETPTPPVPETTVAPLIPDLTESVANLVTSTSTITSIPTSTAAPKKANSAPAKTGKTAGLSVAKSGAGGGASNARPNASANPAPRYPEFARRNGWQGIVLIRVTVTPNGRPKAVSVFRGSGYAVLDQAALESVRRWLFYPRMSGGLAVESTIEVPVTFSLRKA